MPGPINRPTPRLALLALLLVLLAGCNPGIFKPSPPEPYVMLYLLEVYDQQTHLPIPRNTLTIRRETPSGEVISTSIFANQTRFAIQIPADGSQRVVLEVSAAGYQTWSDNYRITGRNPKYLEFNVELVPLPGG